MIADRWKEEPSPEVSDAAERSLLGCILLDPRLLTTASRLNSCDFRSPHRGAVLRAMREMTDYEVPIDGITVARHLRHEPSPPGEWLPALAGLLDGCVPDEEYCLRYAAIIKDAAVLRRAEAREYASRLRLAGGQR